MDFWLGRENMVAAGKVVVDRPKGSVHPRYPSVVYPLDYGYVEGTTSADGHGVDVWRGSLPGTPLVGIVCTVDRLKRDVEIKLLLGCTAQEIEAVARFHNDSDKMSGIVVGRSTPAR